MNDTPIGESPLECAYARGEVAGGISRLQRSSLISTSAATQ